MRIGLLGGSFDPPHQGHIYISLQAKKHFHLHQIWWLPAKNNPFKKTTNPFLKRFCQCQEITKSYQAIQIKDYELKIASCYSFDLLKFLTRNFAKHKFYWIIGEDNLAKFHLWKNWQKIIKLMPVIICRRNYNSHQALKSKAFLYAKKLQSFHFLKIKPYPISSTQLRN